jgi:uncharacterized protein YqjF (DUF2071 family)
MHMTWNDLLFMHWPIPADHLRPLLPPTLELETFDGMAWLGIVPFLMTDVRLEIFPRFMSSVFPEANVRTYVKHGGRSGVWFFSLDAADRIAVWGARRFFHLPYYFAEMASTNVNGVVEYRTRRKADPDIGFLGRYSPTGPVHQTKDGELDHWLTARLSLFSADRSGTIYRGDIRHTPWPLQPAEAEIDKNTLAAAARIVLPDTPPLLHFAKHLEVIAYPIVPSTDGDK